MKKLQNTNEQPEFHPDMTPEQIEAAYMADLEAHAASLAAKYNTPKVHVYVGVSPEGEKIIGFIKDPSYLQKIVALDKIATVGMFMAADELRQTLTLKEESDPRTYETAAEFDGYRLGMTGTCMTMIEVVQNSFKKK